MAVYVICNASELERECSQLSTWQKISGATYGLYAMTLARYTNPTLYKLAKELQDRVKSKEDFALKFIDE